MWACPRGAGLKWPKCHAVIFGIGAPGPLLEESALFLVTSTVLRLLCLAALRPWQLYSCTSCWQQGWGPRSSAGGP